MKKIGNNFYFLLLIFFLVNIIQSVFTPISKDEAYYWMYSQNLDWGYFDHPPMIALLIKLGSFLFKGESGVRLLTNILSVFTLFIIWKLIPEDDRKKEKSVRLFFLLAFSMPLLNIYGFIATPDVPLLFFAALYLYVFLGFMNHQSVVNALKLGVVAALLMYSKYHGALLVLFSLIPHYKLLWNRYFYLAGLVGIALYIPHIYWQYEHDFISFRYHLYQRAVGFMRGKHISVYVLNVFLILNPFLFGLFVFKSLKMRVQNGIPKVFSYVLWGFILFFGITSLRDHIEPQWIGVASIPLTIILVHYFLLSDRLSKTLIPIATGSIVLIVVMRLGIILPLPINTEFHNQKLSYYEAIKERAQDSKVIFINTYSDAARYTFYTGDPAFSYNCYDYRKNQYDIWKYEKIYHNQNAFFLTDYAYPWTDSSIVVEGKKLYYEQIPSFMMINKTTGSILHVDQFIQNNHIHPIEFSVNNPYGFPLILDVHDSVLNFHLVFQVARKRFVVPLGIKNSTIVEPGSEVQLTGYFYPRIPSGEYEVAIGLQPGKMNPVLITEKLTISVF